MQTRWRFAKNAVANLGRGSAAAILALLLPPVLVRHMTPAAYGVWILVLQTAAYVSYLSFGLETAIGRYVAFSNEKKDVRQRDSVFSTAFFGLCCAALLSLVCLAVVAFATPKVFPSVPGYLVPQMRLSLLIVGFVMALGLPASAWNGVFVGIERYEIPALTVGGSRLVSALGLIAAALAGYSLVVLASILAVANLLSYISQYLFLRRVASDIHFQPFLISRSTARELYGYCFGLTVMSFAMLLVTGFDLLLVGRFQFSVVIPYSVAASLITFVSGLLYAVIGVMMPHAASLHAREKAVEMGQLVISSTRLSVLLLLLTGTPLLIYAAPILRLWIGSQYVTSGAPLLSILVVANVIRLIGAPYSIILIAAGQQNFIKISPLAEGASNFVASVVMGMLFGGVGVAFGTLVGALVGMGAHLRYSMPRTKRAIELSRREFLISGVLPPLLCTSPLMVIALASVCGIAVPTAVMVLATLLSLAVSALLVVQVKGIFTKRLGPIIGGNWFAQTRFGLGSREED